MRPSGCILGRHRSTYLGVNQIHSLGGVLGLVLLGRRFVVVNTQNDQQESDGGLELRFAITLLLALLSSPHLYLHDLSAVFLVAI